MPVLSSKYPGPPISQWGGHLQTILPNLLRRVEPVAFRRHRLELADGDFIDLDFSFLRQLRRGILIIGHGLEGSADRPYVRGMARYAAACGYAACAINFRSCSGQLNRLARMYHHGDYPDLRAVCEYLKRTYVNAPLYYVGFSMGGNIGLNYVARDAAHAARHLEALVVFSTPLALEDSISALERSFLGGVYSKRFRKAIGKKLQAKSELHSMPNLHLLPDIATWDDFDRAYSLPLHGYTASAEPKDFYEDVSPLRLLDQVRVPSLIVQAVNDPMLERRCYDTAGAVRNENIYMEFPETGGHVGFDLAGSEFTYAEWRTLDFINNF